jgi:hypothetical protein
MKVEADDVVLSHNEHSPHRSPIGRTRRSRDVQSICNLPILRLY